MKQGKTSQRESVKLPAIGNKTMDSIYRQSQEGKKDRPLSSKNIVGDLQKKLFSQLQAYDQKPLTAKFQKPLLGKGKSKTSGSSSIVANSSKDITQNGKFMGDISQNGKLLSSLHSDDGDSMEKIAQMMPQLYSKILESKEMKPLKEVLMEGNGRVFKEDSLISLGIEEKRSKQRTIGGKGSSRKSVQQQKVSKVVPNKQAEQKTDSFGVAQRQIESIYRQYLQSEGLDREETTVGELKGLNEDLLKCEVDIEELEKSYSNLIKQLGSFCINEIE